MSLPVIQPVPPVLTTDEVAALLRCKPATVANYVHAHELKVIQIGKERRIRGEDLIDFLASRPVTNGGG